MAAPVPLIDFGPFLAGGADERRRVAGAIGRACEDIGFFMLTGHGVPQTLIDALVSVSYRYFALPRTRSGASPCRRTATAAKSRCAATTRRRAWMTAAPRSPT